MSTPDNGASKILYRIEKRGLKEKSWNVGFFLPYNIGISCPEIAIGYSGVSILLWFRVKALGESDRINLSSVTGSPAEFGKFAQKVCLFFGYSLVRNPFFDETSIGFCLRMKMTFTP